MSQWTSLLWVKLSCSLKRGWLLGLPWPQDQVCSPGASHLTTYFSVTLIKSTPWILRGRWISLMLSFSQCRRGLAFLSSQGGYENHELRSLKVSDKMLLQSLPLGQLILELLKALFLLKNAREGESRVTHCLSIMRNTVNGKWLQLTASARNSVMPSQNKKHMITRKPTVPAKEIGFNSETQAAKLIALIQ